MSSILIFHLTEKTNQAKYVRPDRVIAKSIWREPGNWDYFYRFVATVDGDDLEVAFEKTNHIKESWMKNPRVDAAPGLYSARSTSVGDVALLHGKLYLCESVGWTELDFDR